MKKVILLLFILFSVIVISNETVYYYGIKETVIQGKLIREKIKDPAGYNKNAIIYPYFLVLDSPINLLKSADTKIRNRYEIFDPAYNILKIHLNFDSAKMDIESLNGKTVRVSGFFVHSNSRYHYTEVIMEVDNIEEADD